LYVELCSLIVPQPAHRVSMAHQQKQAAPAPCLRIARLAFERARAYCCGITITCTLEAASF
jgi:hypothetical protein